MTSSDISYMLIQSCFLFLDLLFVFLEKSCSVSVTLSQGLVKTFLLDYINLVQSCIIIPSLILVLTDQSTEELQVILSCRCISLLSEYFEATAQQETQTFYASFTRYLLLSKRQSCHQTTSAFGYTASGNSCSPRLLSLVNRKECCLV